MFSKIVRSGEVSGAKGAGERFLSGVTALMFPAVLRIHDILVWIRNRIWIRGSMPLTNGSGN
jgi:hypothetical protein